MKKMFLLLIAIILTFNLNAQIKGVDFSKAKLVQVDNEIENETLLKIEDYYVYFYSSTSVGVKHALEELHMILSANDKTLANATFKDIFLASYVDGLTDYESLARSLNAGSSEVRLMYKINNYELYLFFMEDMRTIVIRPNK